MEPLGGLLGLVPSISGGALQTLLKELKRENLVHCQGRTNAARWFPGAGHGSEP